MTIVASELRRSTIGQPGAWYWYTLSCGHKVAVKTVYNKYKCAYSKPARWAICPECEMEAVKRA